MLGYIVSESTGNEVAVLLTDVLIELKQSTADMDATTKDEVRRYSEMMDRWVEFFKYGYNLHKKIFIKRDLIFVSDLYDLMNIVSYIKSKYLPNHKQCKDLDNLFRLMLKEFNEILEEGDGDLPEVLSFPCKFFTKVAYVNNIEDLRPRIPAKLSV